VEDSIKPFSNIKLIRIHYNTHRPQACKLLSYSKNISDVKKGEVKKVQVTKRLKGVKSLWGQEEKIYQQGFVELQHTKQVK